MIKDQNQKIDVISLNMQILFNTAVRCMVKQNRRCYSVYNGTKEYVLKNTKGLKCSLGHILTKQAIDTYQHFAGEFDIMLGAQQSNQDLLDFLVGLQAIHDNSPTREEFRFNMLNLANIFGLNDNRARRLMPLSWARKEKW